MIPKIIHQIWIDPSGNFGPLPAEVLDGRNTWGIGEPEYALNLWSLPQLFRLCQIHNLPDAGRALQTCRFPSMQADIGRLLLLQIYGGFWVDLKLRLLNPFLDRFTDHDVILTQHYPKDDLPDPGKNMSNSFIGSTPGHPIITQAFRAVVDNVNQRMKSSIYHITGATNLMNALDQIDGDNLGRYYRLSHSESWNRLFQVGAGSYNAPGKHWTEREGHENPYLE
jgi:mannosyltransferase OCH1-like enzyme